MAPFKFLSSFFLLGSLSSVFGGITSYTDRAVFEAALAGLDPSYDQFDENLDNSVADQSFQSSPVALHGFSIEGFGASSTTINIIDVSPFESSGKQSFDTSPYLRVHHFESSRGYTITFAPGAFAWGADVVDVERGNSNLLLSDGSTLDFASDGARSKNFIGFISDQEIFSMTSVGGVTGDAIGLDNMTTILVPEPASAALLLGLLSSFAIFKRRYYTLVAKEIV
jgi:hypothetical protein